MRTLWAIASRPVLAALVTATVTAVLAASMLSPSVSTAAAGHTDDPLRRDVEALHELGVTGVHARLQTPTGTHVVRAGTAELGSGRPVPHDPFVRIGSTTKTFVAVVLLQLVAQGRLSLEDPVERWLPGVVAGNGNDGRGITVRQVLGHTSGLANYVDDLIPRYLTAQDYRRERWRTYSPSESIIHGFYQPSR